MEYILTQEDIERFGLTDAIAGDIATPADLAMMGKYTAPSAPQEERAGALSMPMPSIEAQRGGAPVTQVSADLPYDPNAILPPDVPVEQQVAGTTAAITPAAPAAAGMGGMDMAGLLGLMNPVPQDPFENLSRSQRTMLGFAALKDAGMALQGKEGGAVKNVMADITERADMERKRQAALARQQMLGRLTGGAASGGMDRQAIINAMAMGAIDGPTGTAMLAEIERQSGVSQEIAGKEMMIGQIDALLFDPALSKALGIEGFLRTPFAELGLDTETARVKGRIDQIKGGAFLQAFESLKGGGQITELEGQKAEAAQSRLNTAQSEEDFKNALMEYKFYIEQGIRRLNGEQIAPDTLYDQAASDPLGIR